jgi:hypothetical protein
MAKELDFRLPEDYPTLYQAPAEFDYQGMNQLLAQDPSLLRKLLLNLQASGSLSKSKAYGTSELKGSGQIGSRIDGLGFGVQGGGRKIKGDWGSEKDFSVDPYFDVNYGDLAAYYNPDRMGASYGDIGAYYSPDRIGANYGDIGAYYSPDRMGATYQGKDSQAELGYSPANKLLQLMYSKRF